MFALPARAFVIHVHAVVRWMDVLRFTSDAGHFANQIVQLAVGQHGPFARDQGLTQRLMPFR